MQYPTILFMLLHAGLLINVKLVSLFQAIDIAKKEGLIQENKKRGRKSKVSSYKFHGLFQIKLGFR